MERMEKNIWVNVGINAEFVSICIWKKDRERKK